MKMITVINKPGCAARHDRCGVRMLGRTADARGSRLGVLREAIWAVVATPVLGDVQFDHVARAADHFERARRSMAQWERSGYDERAGAQPDDPLVFSGVLGRSV